MLFYKNVFTTESFFVNPADTPLSDKKSLPSFQPRYQPTQAGFTMLELVVVVAILAIVASTALMSFGNTASDAQHQTARYSMKQIANAVEAYYEDNKNNPVALSPPDRESPADLGFLFNQLDASAADWSPDYRQGWRGPYLKQSQYMYVDVGGDMTVDGASRDNNSLTGELNLVATTAPAVINNVIALSDPYEHFPVDEGVSRANAPCSTNDCFFEWQTQIDPLDVESDDFNGDGLNDSLDKFGRPYLVIDLAHMSPTATGDGVPRVVSLGANGIYEPQFCDYSTNGDCTHDILCNSDGDDLVLCLR